MELSKTKTFENNVASNLDGDDYKIEADAEFFNHLSKRIYTDSQLAIVRELMCNAWDAQVEGGNPQDPIIVHCPNVLEPVFKVIDTGIGMDLQTLKEIYSTYGKSTKRHNMDTTGGLGVGSKTPFAYTDSFTVYSVKDGMKHTMINYKERGIPKIKEIISVPTDEPNGVAVHVPVKVEDFEAFKSRIKAMATVFHGNVKVSGIKHYEFDDNNIYRNESLRRPFKVKDFIVDENLFTVDSDRVNRFTSSEMLVLMGNVPYQLDINKLELKPRLRAFITDDVCGAWGRVACVEVPVGALDFNMSREHLEYSDRTKEVLTTIMSGWFTTLMAYCEDAISKVDNPYDRYQAEYSFHQACSTVFPSPQHVRMDFIQLRRKRGIEQLRRADYGEYVTTKTKSTSPIAHYSSYVPSTGTYEFHIVTYQNRLYKRKRITKLCQDVETLRKCATSFSGYGSGSDDNSSYVILNCTIEQGERIKQIVERNVAEFGGNVTVRLHHLADIEVEKEPQEAKPKSLGKTLKISYDYYNKASISQNSIVDTVLANNHMETGSTIYAWVGSENRNINFDNTELSEEQLITLIKFFNHDMSKPLQSYEYEDDEGDTHKDHVRFKLMLVNKTSLNLIDNYENLIHVDHLLSDYRKQFEKCITQFVKKNKNNILLGISSKRTVKRCGYNSSYTNSYEWDKFKDNLELINKIIDILQLPKLTKHPLLYKTIRLNKHHDRMEARKEYLEKRNTQLGGLELLEDKVSFQLKMFKKYSEKRAGKYRYTKRNKGASNED